MSSIPYNYGKYIDDTVRLRDQGTVDAGKQVQSPASAGSRGLAKTTQFTNDRTQMQMGNSPIAESMIEIRNILNRIDGVNAPVQEKRDNSDIDIRKLLVDISSMKDRIAELAISDDAKTSAFTALGQVEEDIAQEIEGPYPESVKEDLDYRSEDILNKAGFDPADIDTYMKVYNDHGDTSDIDQMNMKEKVGLAEVMSIVLASHGIKNESYKPFPEADEMTFEDDDAFYEAFGELGFPEDETELFDAEYRGRKVPLNKPMRGDVKKFKVYVKDPKTGNVKKVNFGHGGSSARKAGQKTMKIRKSNPKARKSFRARHNCANPGPKTKARYWSCRKW
jgi:hypothetical protein|tara:strand:+ start:307 stop:1311 length:1005 start_codon:yes stop_codon:yes gene_type:complete